MKTIDLDKKYIWHPFTQMSEWIKNEPSEVLSIEKAKGNYLYDSKGKKHFDGVSSLWVNVHGHQKKEIDQAIIKQLSKVAHSTFLGLTHSPASILAKELIEIVPKGLSKVFYSDNGSTSVEIALKMAYQYCQQKNKKSKTSFLSLRNAYHGDTIGSVSVGGMDLFHSKFRKLLFKTHFAQSPHCLRCKKRKNTVENNSNNINFKTHCKSMGCKGECLKEVETILKKNSLNIAAAIVEPMVQGAAGMLLMPNGYLKNFESLCKKYGVLLICDEVATGFGRTGKMFACEIEGINPDILCVAKGITGGYLPLAATITSEKIYNAFLGKFDEFKTFFHGHTYTANPLACAAAIANLKIFKDEKTIRNLKPKIAKLSIELNKLKTLQNVGQVRQLGLMVGIEIVKDKNTLEEFALKDQIGARICNYCRTKGLLIRPLGNVLVLMPPLSITSREIETIVSTISEAIKKTLND